MRDVDDGLVRLPSSMTIIITSQACPSTLITQWRRTPSVTITRTTLSATATSSAVSIGCSFQTAGRRSCATPRTGSTASAPRSPTMGHHASMSPDRAVTSIEAISFGVESLGLFNYRHRESKLQHDKSSRAPWNSDILNEKGRKERRREKTSKRRRCIPRKKW